MNMLVVHVKENRWFQMRRQLLSALASASFRLRRINFLYLGMNRRLLLNNFKLHAAVVGFGFGFGELIHQIIASSFHWFWLRRIFGFGELIPPLFRHEPEAVVTDSYE